MSALLAIAGADFNERVRRFTFFVLLAAALYAGYMWVPAPSAGYGAVIVNGHRGLYNSAFLGYATSMLICVFMSLLGFFFVRGSIERDHELDVDGIVCASPVTRVRFVMGKFLSNLAVLMTIAACLMVAAALMQFLRAQDLHFDVASYVVPFAFVVLPAMAFVAAIAILLDLIPFMRGTIGGIVYFVGIWGPLLSIPMQRIVTGKPAFDVLGVARVMLSMQAAAHAQFPGQHGGEGLIGIGVVAKSQPFVYSGFPWSAALVGERLLCLLAAVGLVILASLWFDRFRREDAGRKQRRFTIDIARFIPNVPMFRLLRAEVALLVNGASMWWLLGAVALTICCVFVPMKALETFFLPVALIWPLERLSALGSRERRWNVEDILASTRGYAQRTLLVQWIAGSIVGAAICTGFIVRQLASGDAVSAIACVAVCAATAACALALGTWTGARRVFEAAYLVAWYLGPVNGVPFLNFSGAMLTQPIALGAIGCAVSLVAIVLAGSGRVAALAR